MTGNELKKALLREDCFDEIIGQEAAKEQLKSALVAGRNLIIIGPPGIGKTTLAKNVAKLLPEITANDCGFNCMPGKPSCPACTSNGKADKKKSTGLDRFIRVQGSPDITAEDLLGDIDPIKALKFGPTSLEAFTPGKIFRANNGILFFDELNRCPARLQNALLQVLEEKKATLGGYKVDFEADFIFMGSLPPEEEILIFEGKMLKRVKIGQVVDRQLENYGKSIRNGSEITTANPQKLCALAFNPKTRKIEPLPITAFIRHKPTDFLYELTLAKGRAVKVTGKHSVFVQRKSELTPIEVSQLKAGDKIAIPKKIEYPSQDIQKIDLLQFFKVINLEKQIYLRGEGIKQLIEEHKPVLSSIRTPHLIANYKYYSHLPLEAVQIEDIEKAEHLTIGINGSKNTIKQYLTIDNELSWLLGFLVAEGFTQKYLTKKGTYSYTIWAHNKDREKIRKVSRILTQKFGVKPHEIIDKRTGVYGTTISCYPLFRVLRDLLEIPVGSENKKVPQIVFQLNKEKIRHFLQGYLEGDGSFSKGKSGQIIITMGTTSKQLANDLAYLFLLFGKIASIRKVEEKRENHKDCYQLYLCKTHVNSILDLQEDDEFIGFEKITSVKKLEMNPVNVYDLEVLNTKELDNFIGGFGGVLLHNTMNPYDTSTEKLSDVFLDRFDLIYMTYPESYGNEEKIVLTKGKKIGNVEFPQQMLSFAIAFVRQLRENSKLEKLPSVRATIGLYERAQSNALIRGRRQVEEKDIKDAILSVLAHRIGLKPSARYVQKPEEFIKEELEDFMQTHTTQKGDGR